MTVTDSLTPIESRLVALLSAKPDARQEDIAAELGKSTRHVRRLLARASVRRALDGAARDGLARASTLLGNGAQRAAQALVSMATGATRATTPRVSACRVVLEGAARLVEAVNVDERLRKLEAAASRPAGGYQ